MIKRKTFLLVGALCFAGNIYAQEVETTQEVQPTPIVQEPAASEEIATLDQPTRYYGAAAIVKTLRGGEISVHVGGAIPLGNFKKDYTSPNLANGDFSAGTGFIIGVKDIFAVSSNGVGTFVSADFIYNGLSGPLKEYYDVAEDNDRDVTRHKYINIPLLVGVNYRHGGFWVEGGIGLDVRVITKHEYAGISTNSSGESYSFYYKWTYKPQVAFAFQVGAGVMLSPRYSLGLNYYGLGGAKVKMKTLYEERLSSGAVTSKTGFWNATQGSSQNVLLVRLGYHF